MGQVGVSSVGSTLTGLSIGVLSERGDQSGDSALRLVWGLQPPLDTLQYIYLAGAFIQSDVQQHPGPFL